MGLSADFNTELQSIETRFSGGLSNTSTKKFDELIKIVSEISGVPVDKIYITAAASRASNLWNRLAQGKPLTNHYVLAVGIIGEADLESGLAPAKKFIGDGNGHYDAICLATKANGEWSIKAMVEKAELKISETIRLNYPQLQIETLSVGAEKDSSTAYTDEDFLKDVYMSPSDLKTLKSLLFRKKNLIIQGAPGVGKSYAAKRLAYAVMEQKDDTRILNVQFHQSYSYEDFVMGYKPNNEGFVVEEGPFFSFCNTAKDKEEPYFIIIDEINRGNMSRIFGELLMLIESDKRGEPLKLMYQKKGESFFVPDNIFIIGMMNTADRSLAVIDYALRRRFAFFDFAPAFKSDGFQAYQKSFSSESLNRLISIIEQLNDEIASDESLGDGFRIGHSYFCNLDSADNNSLSAIIEYEIIPLLKEYWFDDKKRVDMWSDKLRGTLND